MDIKKFEKSRTENSKSKKLQGIQLISWVWNTAARLSH